jgi:hypothetical protein
MREALGDGDFTEALRAYEALPYREKRILSRKHARVILYHRNSLLDFVLQFLVPWEGAKGAWCIRLDDEALVLGFDSEAYLAPAARGWKEKSVANLQWGVWWYFQCER